MNNQLTSNAEALRLFFTEDVYLVNEAKHENLVNNVEEKVSLTLTETVIETAKETIVVEEVAITIEEQKSAPKKEYQFEFLGKNQKAILILVNDQFNKVSTLNGTELLRKLVKAIELTNNDFALVNYAAYEGASFEDFHQFFSCQLLLSFGVDAAMLQIEPKPLHQLFKSGETKMILTKNLNDLGSDQDGKKALWATLQTLKNA